MNREVVALIEAVRALKIAIVATGDSERIKIGCASEEFPTRLMALQRALEAVDRAGGAGLDGKGAEPPKLDSVKLQLAIDKIFKWMKGQGLDVTQPYALLEEAMEIPPEKRRKKYDYKMIKEKTKRKNPLKLIPRETLRIEDFKSLQRHAYECEAGVQGMGAALVQPTDSDERRKARQKERDREMEEIKDAEEENSEESNFSFKK
jgi:hypothetical protein